MDGEKEYAESMDAGRGLIIGGLLSLPFWMAVFYGVTHYLLGL